jgi:hypothetical protein
VADNSTLLRPASFAIIYQKLPWFDKAPQTEDLRDIRGVLDQQAFEINRPSRNFR